MKIRAPLPPGPMVESVGDLLALDPSVTNPGAALFRAGVLLAAAKVKIPDEVKTLDPGARWLRVAEEILRWAFVGCRARPRVLVYERPQWYTRDKSAGDPNDLAGLVGVGAALSGTLAVALLPCELTLRVVTYTPAEWAGQVPKSKTGDGRESVRGQRIMSALSEAERVLVPKSHDAVDGVGIGLKALGRYERKMILQSSL